MVSLDDNYVRMNKFVIIKHEKPKALFLNIRITQLSLDGPRGFAPPNNNREASLTSLTSLIRKDPLIYSQ